MIGRIQIIRHEAVPKCGSYERCSMRMRILVIGAMLAVSPMAARAAATCDEFKAAMIEDAKQPPGATSEIPVGTRQLRRRE